MSTQPATRREAMAHDHNLSHKAAQFCSNALEVAVVTSGGFSLVKSVRRVMTDLVSHETGTLEANGDVLRRKGPYSSHT